LNIELLKDQQMRGAIVAACRGDQASSHGSERQRVSSWLPLVR
jgi:hypothetical protein